MSSLRNLSAVVILTFLLTVYLKQQTIEGDESEKRRRLSPADGADGNFIRKIVAYSLKKQMEMERAPTACGGSALSGNHDDSGGTGKDLRVFSVHVDRRLHPYDYVRILAMVKGNWNDTLFCNLYLRNGKILAMRAVTTEIWAENWVDEDASENFNPTLISCQIPADSTPKFVHLSKTPCRPTSTKLVFQNKVLKTKNADRSKITVCVKPLNFQKDISKRLAKWILMNVLLGADRIVIYVRKVHEKTLNFLKWYAGNNSLVKLKPALIKNNEDKLWQKRKNEVLIYNHCFYENLEDSDYILPIDIDEIVIPKNAGTWQDLIPDFPRGYASYLVRNAYYLLNSKKDDIFTTFQRTVFSSLGESGKSFVSTRDALTVFNHYALHALRPGIGRCAFLPEGLVQMNHYKETCPLDLLPECVKYLSSPRVYDGNILKYKKSFDLLYFNLTKYYKL